MPSARLNALIPMLSVVDLKRTMTFYGDLGFRTVNTFGDPEPRWCMLERDGVRLMFNQPPREEMDALPRRAKDFQVFYFYPDDVTALHSNWKSKAVDVGDLRVAIYGMKEFELRDPDGYWLWFGQSTDEQPTGTE
ncbi:MAG: VOC family protein [Rhizobiales bacterium]|nr:VOC family protein [Hyphomicrobiales bacterium]